VTRLTDNHHDRAEMASSATLANVRYEIRGQLSRRASELERMGYEILALNIGNPGHFGFRTPETMRLAIIENLGARVIGPDEVRERLGLKKRAPVTP
jgi:hypothetical protein